ADDQQSGETVPGLDVGFVIGLGCSLGHHGEGNYAATDAAQCAAAAEHRFDHSKRQIGGDTTGEPDKDRRLRKIIDAAGRERYIVARSSATANSRVEPADAWQVNEADHRLAGNGVGDRN